MRDVTRPPRDGKDPSAARLRLVHPSPPKTLEKKANRHRPAFSNEENGRLRAALKHARAMFGTWGCAADALYAHQRRLQNAANGKYRVTADIAVRLARALGVPLEALLRGLTAVPKVCPHCGRGPT